MTRHTKSTSATPRRKRRTPEAARRAILDAASRCLVAEGPDGLRLQSIAADLGISHSSILHHFGSREGLLDALAQDAFGALERDLRQSIRPSPEGEPASEIFEKVSRALVDRGFAKLLAWQILSGRGATEPGKNSRVAGPNRSGGILDGLAHTLHSIRLEHAQNLGRVTPTLDDTRSIVALAACSIFGEALAGSEITAGSGLGGGAEDRRRFRGWAARTTERLLFEETGSAEDAD